MPRRTRDPFSAHEAMDRTHLVATVIHDFIAEHPFIQSNAKLRREVEAVANALGELYQSVGRTAFEVHSEDMSPGQLAKELGISPKTLRAFLRKEFPRESTVHGERWELNKEQIAAARKRWTAKQLWRP